MAQDGVEVALPVAQGAVDVTVEHRLTEHGDEGTVGLVEQQVVSQCDRCVAAVDVPQRSGVQRKLLFELRSCGVPPDRGETTIGQLLLLWKVQRELGELPGAGSVFRTSGDAEVVSSVEETGTAVGTAQQPDTGPFAGGGVSGQNRGTVVGGKEPDLPRAEVAAPGGSVVSE